MVYRARQESLGRDVAIKMLTMPDVDSEAVGRFAREAELLARLTSHPSVVTILDSGITRSGRPYLVMPFFEGGSLADRLAVGPLPVPDVLHTGVRIAGALAAAHQEGILHRDVKPQNILVSKYGEPALADFGIARLLDTADVATRTDALTPYHAAPEVLDGQPHSAAADVYSLGSTLYQLLAGQPPFWRAAGEGLAPLLLRILTEPPPPIPRPDVPAPLRDALMVALAKQPAGRFPQASAFAVRLQEIQAQLGLPVTSLTPMQSARPAFAPPDGGASAAHGPAHIGAPRRAGDLEQTPPDPDLAETLSRSPSPALTTASATPAAPHPHASPDGGAGGYGLDETIVRRRRRALAPPPAPSPQRHRRRWLLLAGGFAVAVAAAAASVLAVSGRPHPSPLPSPSGPSSPPVPAAVLNTARPGKLKVVASGTSAVLTWQLAAGSRYPLAILRSSPGAAPAAQPVSGSDATTTAAVTGLDPHKGYCFEVGAVVRLGNPSTIAWSAPACIRGAAPAPSP